MARLLPASATDTSINTISRFIVLALVLVVVLVLVLVLEIPKNRDRARSALLHPTRSERRAFGSRQHGVGLVVVHETFGLHIPGQRPLEFHRDPTYYAGGVAAMRDRRRREWCLARLHTFEPVPMMLETVGQFHFYSLRIQEFLAARVQRLQR